MKIKKTQKYGLASAKAKKEDGADDRAVNEKINRTVYMTVAVLIVVMIAAIAMTTAANRARREEAENTSDLPPSTTFPEQTLPHEVPPRETTPNRTDTVTPSPETPVVETVPTLILPVAAGSIGKAHNPTMQVYSSTLGEWRVHLGVDIMTDTSAAVMAAAAGTVSEITDDGLWGTCVTVKHAGNSVTVYKNLSQTLAEGIEVGKKIKAGTVIGTVGDAAFMEIAEEPHLHFEMKIGGEDVDPTEYFSAEALASVSAEGDVFSE